MCNWARIWKASGNLYSFMRVNFTVGMNGGGEGITLISLDFLCITASCPEGI